MVDAASLSGCCRVSVLPNARYQKTRSVPDIERLTEDANDRTLKHMFVDGR